MVRAFLPWARPWAVTDRHFSKPRSGTGTGWGRPHCFVVFDAFFLWLFYVSFCAGALRLDFFPLYFEDVDDDGTTASSAAFP